MSLSVAVPTAVDRRQPWLGLSSYREADAALFFGRENEELELLRLVRREVLTVIFGPSGTGKTSLLNAGLFPRLRESAYLPIPIRLDHLSDRPDYVAQIRARIDEALHADATRLIEEQSLAPQPAQDDPETLWEYLHRVVFWDWRNNPVTPVLVFDQFEEVFTLGRNHAASEEFLTALADLVENYIPAVVRSRTEANGGPIPFAHDQPKVKVILSLREDFVCRLDDLRKSMPSVMRNRFAVARMNGKQALRAVREPGQGIVEEPVARQIVHFVAACNRPRAAADDQAARLDTQEVDPALLSVVCRELNAHRIEREKAKITADLLEQTGTNILHDFYERGFAGLNPAIRVFVEDRLLTLSGFRSTVPLEEATHAGIADEDIRTLVDRRLIRVEERLGILHLELTHDLLTKVVQKSRAERQEREQREREKKQRETEERERAQREEGQRTELRRARRLLVIVSGAAVICLLLGVLAFLSYRKAGIETAHAVILRDEASVAAAEAMADKKKADTANQMASGAEAEAKDALSTAQRNEVIARQAAQEARIETIKREISQATSEFKISPTRGLLLAVEALNASTREQLACDQNVTCGQFAAAALVDQLSQTGGTPIIGHTKPVLALSFSADGKLLATADERTVNVWRAEELSAPFAVLSSPEQIQSMSLSGDGKFVATASFGQARLFWIDQPQKSPFHIQQPGAYLNNMGDNQSVWFSVDGKLFLAADGVGNASVWRLDPREDPKFIAKIPDGFLVKFASFTSDEKSILTLDIDGKVWKWQLDQILQNVKPVPVYLGNIEGSASTAFFSGNGQHLLIPRQLVNTQSLDRVARLINLRNFGDEQLHGDELKVATQAVALSSEGGLVAIAGDGGTIQIWRAFSTRMPGRTAIGSGAKALYGHEGPVYAVSFSPDGTYIATAGQDRTARLWQIDQPFAIDPYRKAEDWSSRVGELVQLAAKTAGRNFTCKEWREFFPGEKYRLTFPKLPVPVDGGCPKQAKSN